MIVIINSWHDSLSFSFLLPLPSLLSLYLSLFLFFSLLLTSSFFSMTWSEKKLWFSSLLEQSRHSLLLNGKGRKRKRKKARDGERKRKEGKREKKELLPTPGSEKRKLFQERFFLWKDFWERKKNCFSGFFFLSFFYYFSSPLTDEENFSTSSSHNIFSPLDHRERNCYNFSNPFSIFLPFFLFSLSLFLLGINFFIIFFKLFRFPRKEKKNEKNLNIFGLKSRWRRKVLD